MDLLTPRSESKKPNGSLQAPASNRFGLQRPQTREDILKRVHQQQKSSTDDNPPPLGLTFKAKSLPNFPWWSLDDSEDNSTDNNSNFTFTPAPPPFSLNNDFNNTTISSPPQHPEKPRKYSMDDPFSATPPLPPQASDSLSSFMLNNSSVSSSSPYLGSVASSPSVTGVGSPTSNSPLPRPALVTRDRTYSDTTAINPQPRRSVTFSLESNNTVINLRNSTSNINFPAQPNSFQSQSQPHLLQTQQPAHQPAKPTLTHSQSQAQVSSGSQPHPPIRRKSLGDVQDAIPSANELLEVPNREVALRDVSHGLVSSEWHVQQDSVFLLRRLVAFHPDYIAENLRDIVPPLIPLVDNLRSYLARSAIRVITEMFQQIGDRMGNVLRLILPMLFKKFAESNAFIRSESEVAVEAMVLYAQPLRCLETILLLQSDKAAVVRARVANTLTLLLANHGSELCSNEKALQRIVVAVKKFLGEGRLDTRTSAKQAQATLLAHTPPALRKNLKDIL
eukprot:c4434_g1_i1.p1 GENE.c4434_g1_i1~~c4434_g1_i1.p1  ORF type:complete len:505 (+),score=129.35 c4434_g1_i1:411-1925(+)